MEKQEKNYDLRLGHMIKNWRNLRGLTQRNLADTAGVTCAYISRIEAGQFSAGINLEKLEKIAAELGFKLSEFIAMAEKSRDEVLTEATVIIKQLEAARSE